MVERLMPRPRSASNLPDTPSPVWIMAAGTQDGPITDRPIGPQPLRTLREMSLAAARAALARRPDLRARIDGIYLGTMGVWQRGSEDRVHPAHIPNILRAELHLDQLRTVGAPRDESAGQVVTGTSEAGALALLHAFRDLQRGRCRTALVVAGEQMFSTDAARRDTDREDNRRWIRSVLAPQEAALGLSMLSVGDLVMDHVAWQSGSHRETWREVLRAVTLRKYRDVAPFERALWTAKARDRGARPDDPGAYAAARMVTPWFSMHDVAAPSNGATALILTTDPKRLDSSAPIALHGMGNGQTGHALAQRSGPFGRASAVRRALRNLCHHGALTPGLLADHTALRAVLHDAFPSIELVFLREIAAATESEPTWLADAYASGWSNPWGGLLAHGHALGNSGLLQVALAFEALASGRGAPFVLTTSVGSALTHIVAALLGRHPDVDTRLEAERAAYDPRMVESAFPRPAADPLADLDETLLASMGPDDGLVLAATRAADQTVAVVAGSEGRAWLRTDEPLAAGAIVRLAPERARAPEPSGPGAAPARALQHVVDADGVRLPNRWGVPLRAALARSGLASSGGPATPRVDPANSDG